MRTETYLKLKTQATSATINFVRELIVVDERNIDDTKKEASIMETYTKDLLENCSYLLNESLEKNFPPLQEEILALLACIASLIEDEFAQYYNNFMPGLKTILENTPNDTRQQRDLKSNTIQCIGFLLEAVKEKQDEFSQDAIEIAQAFMSLLQPGVLKEDDP